MNIVHFVPGDTLVMKKQHPCGGNSFTVLRTGSDVRMVCTSCKRDVTVKRIKLDRNIKQVISNAVNNDGEERNK